MLHVILPLVALIISLIFVACGQQSTTDEGSVPSEGEIKSTSEWMNIELKDIATGDRFAVADFKGKPVLLESFAVWCPTCLRQQQEINELKLATGDDIVHISLDTDPNEDESRVKEHLETHGFDWYFAVSPIELTNALIDEFGLGIVNAPGAPVLLICSDQSTRFLRNGVKSANDLLAEVEKGC
jgi:cytochrome oxidase Cu insertion factor (SCO1/SenC/PrrC family)